MIAKHKLAVRNEITINPLGGITNRLDRDTPLFFFTNFDLQNLRGGNCHVVPFDYDITIPHISCFVNKKILRQEKSFLAEN